MSAVLPEAVVLLTVSGLLCGALVLARSHGIRQALAVLLDFLLAAGLLRLAGEVTYGSLATAAAIIVVRKIVMAGFGSGGRDRRPVGRLRAAGRNLQSQWRR